MNGLALLFLLVNIIAVLSVPRRWAPLPLLIGACYMTLGQGTEIGSLHFPLIRILILGALVRVAIRGERIVGKINALDKTMVVWAIVALITSVFHKEPLSELINRGGLILNVCGIYFLLRCLCQSLDDVAGLCRVTAILLVPLAVEMAMETVTRHNLFSVFGGVSPTPEIREGRLRAQGPFMHAILAGTVAGVCLPMMVGLWRSGSKIALVGLGAALLMIVTCASSGPIMTALASVAGLVMWRWRQHMQLVRRLAVVTYIGLDIVMKAPAYYVIAKMDITSGSTGYHRAALIQSAITHLSEWWLFGTDYTRHWMATGVSWSPDHTDITNQYILMGVIGGLPLMIVFIALFVKGFSFVGQELKERQEMDLRQQFFLWSLGVSLFAHMITCVSVSYFDQSFIFLYLTLGAIGSMRHSRSAAQAAVAAQVTPQPVPVGAF
jgi:hypothetical protein